jgi:hypothetical protein
MLSKYGDLIDKVNANPEWTDEVEKEFTDAVGDFKKNGAW